MEFAWISMVSCFCFPSYADDDVGIVNVVHATIQSIVFFTVHQLMIPLTITVLL
ncbi:hypothetical protein [Bacillus toyonensis]|uniref:hypothetical protein n=1 Tax=Bacillus toyonensis TaxID=155322 RepID=UPI003D652C00